MPRFIIERIHVYRNNFALVTKRAFAVNLPELKERISGIENIGRVCESMKNISASRMPKAMRSLYRARQFTESIEPIWKQTADEKDVKKYLFFLVTSNFGLCGNVNSRVTNAVENFIRAKGLQYGDFKLCFAGTRGSQLLAKYKQMGCFSSVINGLHESDFFTMDCASELAEKAVFNKGYDKLIIFYNYFESRTDFSTRTYSFLSREKALANCAHLDHYENDYMATQTPVHLDNLYSLAVSSAIYSAVLETAAVEQCKRFFTMQNATKNIEDMVAEMRVKYNALRQEKVTTDICEVNAGLMAVMQSEIDE